MKKVLLALTATFAVCLAVFAGKNMCLRLDNGQVIKYNVDRVYEVYFEDIFNPDTSSIIPPFIEPTVADTSAYAPLRFEITSDSTVELTDGNYRGLDSVNIPAKVKIDGKVYSVTSIGDGVFIECFRLTSVAIPSSVTSIGSYAFYGCSSLTSIEIPSSVTSIGEKAFYYCRSLTEIIIPSSVTSIGESAFSVCSSLESINVDAKNPNYSSLDGVVYNKEKTEIIAVPEGIKGSISIPSSVTSIGSYAFYDCSSLTSVEIPSSVTSIGEAAFYGCSSLTSIEIPSSVTSIGEYAFYGCENLDVVIENTEENVEVGSWAFDGVKSVTWKKDMDSSSIADTSAYAPLRFEITSDSTVELTRGENWDTYYDLDSVNIPAKVKIDGKVYSVTSIGSDAFAGGGRLTSIEIPSSVTSIGDGAFWGCDSIKSINIPSSVTSIGERVFYYCRSLTSINVDANNPSYTSIDGIVYDKEVTRAILVPNGIKGEVIIPDGVVSIDSVFIRCDSLTSIIIPEGVTEISEYAFYWCHGLTSITIPSSVTSIGERAFEDCSSLTSVAIPSSVTSIGYLAFYSCSSLASIEIPSSVTSIGSYAFEGCRSLTSIAIPSSVTSIDSYTFSGCSSLTSVEIPSSVTSIGDGVFSGCSSLESINVDAKNPNYSSLDGIFYNKEKTEIIAVPNGIKGSISIPESVTSIGDGVFSGCSSLESINVDVKNPNYSSLDGILYNKDKTEIIKVPEGIKGSFSIPSSVTSIGDGAFIECSSLTSVAIPSSVTSIGSYAFEYCSSLTSVAIPSSVTSIGSFAFYNCKNLDVVIENSKENVKFLGWNGKETTMEKSNAFYGVKSVKWLK